MNTPAPVPQSNFVSVLAWIMMAFGALGILVGLLQLVILNLVIPQFEAAMSEIGPVGAFPIAFFRVMLFIGLAFAVFMTYAAYALLKRRNWARILFIVLFIISAVSHVLMGAGLGLGFSLVEFPSGGSEVLPAGWQSVMSVMAVSIAVFMLVMGVVYVWLALRLRSPAIAAEFAATPGAA